MNTQLPATQSDQSEKVCENCHNKLDGPYCSHCGQSVESSLKYFWTVILHILDDIFSFDSRASRTLFPLLFKPGFLTNEYFAGRRVHYVPPLRLYLFISIIFFLSLKFFVDTDDKSIFNGLNESQQLSEQIQQQIDEIEKVLPNVSGDTKVKLEQQLTSLKSYIEDINQSDNQSLNQLALQIAELELKQVSTDGSPVPPLSSADKIRYQTLKDMLAQQRDNKFAQEKVNINIGNQADGSLKLPFLNEEQNQQLSVNAKLLETKAEELLRSKPEKIFQEALEKLPQIMFVILPLFALLLKIMYLFSGRLYMEHLTVALHSHSFIFLNLLLAEICTTLAEEALIDSAFINSIFNLMAGLLICWIPIYLFMMQKRVYQQGRIMTSLKFISVGIFYMCLLASAAIVAFIWGVLSIAE